MKMLNLFAGIGGNRLFFDYDDVVAVECEIMLGNIYKKRFPNDVVVIDNAWTYLEKHFHEFDFIWASPPCQSHTKMNKTHVGRRYNGWNMKVKIPDMKLYGLIVFLQHHFRGNYIVENVKPFYEPLIKPSFEIGRHLFWSNVKISSKKIKLEPIMYSIIENYNEYINKMCEIMLMDRNLIGEIHSNFAYNHDKWGQVLRNTIHPEISKYIWNEMTKENGKLDDLK